MNFHLSQIVSCDCHVIQVASDLQALEDSFCETIDSGISMESAQEMLDHYQPLAAGLRDNYPAMKQLGELLTLLERSIKTIGVGISLGILKK